MRSPQGLMRQAEQESKRNKTDYYDTLLKIIIDEHKVIKDAAAPTVEGKRQYNEQKEKFTETLQELVAGYSKEEQEAFYKGMLAAAMSNFIKGKSASTSDQEFLRGSEWETIIKAPLGAYLDSEYSEVGMKKFCNAALEEVKIEEGKENQKAYKSSLGKFIKDNFTTFKKVLLSGSRLRAATVVLASQSLSQPAPQPIGSFRGMFSKKEEVVNPSISTPLGKPSSEPAKAGNLAQELLAIQVRCEVLVQQLIKPNNPLDGTRLNEAKEKLEAEQKKYLAILPGDQKEKFISIVKMQEAIIIQAGGLSLNSISRAEDIEELGKAQKNLAAEVNGLKKDLDEIAKQESKTATKPNRVTQFINRLSSRNDGGEISH